ncbi:MAG: polymer-forming cytoskeletal protein [Candidatus Binatus sp.]
MALLTREPEKNSKIQLATATPGPAPSEASAYLNYGSKITGKISFAGSARIDGEVDGEINAEESLTIGESAVVTAQIRAASVWVAGKVSGDIVATRRIEILPSAKVSGSVTAPLLSVRDGALFEGRCSTKKPESIREDRKLMVLATEDRLAQTAEGQ